MPDPTVIQGFESNQPPPPPLDMSRIEEDPDGDWAWPGEGYSIEPGDAASPSPASPLIPKPPVAVSRPSTQPQQINPASLGLELVVIDHMAYFKGHEVSLTQDEKAQVARVVLAALRRDLDDHAAQLAPQAVFSDKEMAEINSKVFAPKKRGRPKKNA